MKKLKLRTIVLFFAVLTLQQLAGCAGSDTAENDSHYEPPSMGHNPHGDKQGPPPTMVGDDMNSYDRKTNVSLSAEAITACIGRKLGERVEFTGFRGETVKAVCGEYDDHLVAIPEQMMNKETYRR